MNNTSFKTSHFDLPKSLLFRIMTVPAFHYDNEAMIRDYNEWKVTAPSAYAYDITMDYFGHLKNTAVVAFGCGDGLFLKKCMAKGATDCLGLDSNEMMIKSGLTGSANE